MTQPAPAGATTEPPSTRSRMMDALREVTTPERLLLAVKSAIAATAAWLVARLLPGFLDEYSYYAPFGAVVAMLPNVMASVRSAFEMVLGLLIGGTLAYLAILTVAPSLVVVPVAVAIGVLVSGFLPPGAGRDYVPGAAIFVMMVGGGNADEYAPAYILVTGLGLAIGVIVNFVVAPPLGTGAAAASLSTLRMRIGSLLDRLADQIERGEITAESRAEAVDLDHAVDESEDALLEAEHSRKANARALLRRRRDAHDSTAEAFGHLRASVPELVALAGLISTERSERELPDDLSDREVEQIVRSLRALADLYGDDDVDGAAADEAVAVARRTLRDWDAPTPESQEAAHAFAYHLGTLSRMAPRLSES